MPFDAHKNLAIASVVTPPSPAASGTTLVVGAGQGARFGAVPFNATVWPIDMAPDPTTAEVVRVTARTTDTLTIVRAQEGTTARTILAGDLFAATITAKSLTDIESGTNFPLITTPGAVTSGGDLRFTGPTVAHYLAPQTTDGADTQAVLLCGGGNETAARGASILLTGNEHGWPGNMALSAGSVGGVIQFATGADANRGVIHASGGFSWGSTTDPGAGNLSVAGDVILTGTYALHRTDSQAGADTKAIYLMSTPVASGARGAYIYAAGNQFTGGPGELALFAGNVPTGAIRFFTGADALRGMIHASGGFSWGGTSDPGAGVFTVGGPPSVGSAYCYLDYGGTFLSGKAGTGGSTHFIFQNANGNVGSIQSTGTTTAYVTTSDARLKTSLNRHTDPSVLRDTVIHNFTWKADGTPGRGVFAQEAVTVLPAAVSVGGDERDSGGNLTRPWGVDYSKYVPDLITGWQQHDAIVADLCARLTAVEAATIGTSTPPPSVFTKGTAPPPESLRMTLWHMVGNFMTAIWRRPSWI